MIEEMKNIAKCSLDIFIKNLAEEQITQQIIPSLFQPPIGPLIGVVMTIKGIIETPEDFQRCLDKMKRKKLREVA